MMTVAALKAFERDAQERPEREFGKTRPLPSRRPQAPALPEDLIPGVLRPWLIDISDRMQVPLEMAAAPALVGIASLIGRKVTILPKAEDDWLVVPNLWGGIVASPGKLKSPTLAKTLRPIKELESQAGSRAQADADRLSTSVEILKAKESAIKIGLRSSFGGSKGARPTDELKQELISVHGEIREAEANSCVRRYVVNDSTTEKLGELLKSNPQGLLLERDELAGWLQSLERHDRPGDREFFLEAWNGTNGYTYDRIGRGTIQIPALCVSMIGGIQPAKLSRFVSEALAGGNAADGLLQRFQILVWPEHDSIWKLVDRKPSVEVEERVRALYRRLDALPRPTGADLPSLRFCPDAQVLFYAWLTELETRLRSEGMAQSPAFESHLAKYRSLMPSLALIFQLIENPSLEQTVSLEAAKLAADWCEFLEQHARKVYAGELGLDNSAAHELLSKIRAGAVTNGTTIRDIYNNGWANLKNSDQVLRAAGLLEECGWARLETVRAGRSGGRPSTVLAINPAIFGSQP